LPISFELFARRLIVGFGIRFYLLTFS